MSAWIVSKHHIDAVVTAWVKLHGRDGAGMASRSSFGRPDEIGQMLWQENHTSVNYRYRRKDECPKYTWTEVPWPIGEPDAKTLATVCKLVNCYTYQSCEHDEWEASTSNKFCDTLIGYVCRNLPGYEEAPWGIDSEERNVFVVTRKKGS